MKIRLICAILFSANIAYSQGTTMVYDINQSEQNGGSELSRYTPFNGKLYFSAKDAEHGTELWVYDGANPPTMVFDINTGEGFSFPSQFIVYKNQLFFSAFTTQNGSELWKYDGVNDPTMVADINLGEISSNIQSLFVFDTLLVFFAYSPQSGYEIWKYNGVDAPSMVANIAPNDESSGPSRFVNFNNKLYFSANNSVNGRELWEYDGSSSPSIVSDIQTGTGSSNPSEFIVYDNKLYFNADGSSNNYELWVYDGLNNPSLVFDPNILLGSYPRNFTVFNNKLFYSANDGTNGTELWVYDGSSNPTMLGDITSSDQYAGIRGLTVANNLLYFYSINEASDTTIVWTYDGVNAPSPVTINPILEVGSMTDFSFTEYNGAAYFRNNVDSTGLELWRHDGLSTPTVIDIVPGPTSSLVSFEFAVFNNRLLFSADDGIHGHELMAYDGTNAPILIKNINQPVETESSFISRMAEFNNDLYFFANDNIHGRELWKYDGVNNPMLVADINLGANDCDDGRFYPLNKLIEFNNKLYFSADDGISGGELWTYDGTNPPSQVADIFSGSKGSNPHWFKEFNNKLYFAADDSLHGTEIWQYDGINSPTLVSDIFPGINSCFVSSNGSFRTSQASFTPFIEYNNKLYFSATDGINGTELWSFDGINNPSMFDDLNPGFNESSDPAEFFVFNDILYFAADNGIKGRELWSYNGSGIPTLVQDLTPGTEGSEPSGLFSYNNKLFFNSYGENFYYSSYYYDGTNPPVPFYDSEIYEALVFNNSIYFTSDGEGYGLELMFYNGTNQPTLAADINPLTDSWPSYFQVFNNKLYFAASNGIKGDELWVHTPCVMTSTVTSQTNVSCNDLQDGAASIAVSGNTGGLLYYWQPSANTTAALSGVGTGTYVCTVIDSSSLCRSEQRIIITAPIDIKTTRNSDTLSANQSGATYQWVDCNNNNSPVSGATGQSFKVTTNGRYAVRITLDGCTATSQCNNITNVGINEAENNSSVRIYPNPSRGLVYIEALENDIDKASVINSLGKEVATYTQLASNSSINLNSLPNGVYFVKITSKERVTSKRILIMH